MRPLLLSLLLLAGCDVRPSNWYSKDLVDDLNNRIVVLQHENDSLRVALAADTVTYIQSWVIVDRSDISAPLTIEGGENGTTIQDCYIKFESADYWSDTTRRPMSAISIGSGTYDREVKDVQMDKIEAVSDSTPARP